MDLVKLNRIIMKEKYLFFYLNTGGGHLAPARAVAAQFEKLYGNEVEIKLVDGLENANKSFKDLIEKGYKFLQNKMPWFYEFLYAVNKMSVFSKSTINNINKIVQKDFEKIIVSENPQKIIIFHSFLIEPTLNVLKKFELKIPLIIAVTDPITPPPIWFYQNDLDYIVFSEDAKKVAIKKNISESNINIFPFVLNEKFSKQLTNNEINEFKDIHNLRIDKPLVLIIGGADGIPKGKKLLKRLVEINIDADIAIVCGRNNKLFEKCMKYKDKHPDFNIRVYGFIDFVFELMSSADIVISKCGASTFMEILLTQKIPVINSYLWEQEKGNVDYITNNNLGIYETSSKKIADFCKNMLTDKSVIMKYKTNIFNANLENGSRKVADFIKNYQRGK